VTVGPSEAFALFFKNNSGPVFRALFAGTLNRVTAEDATAEAFVRAFAHWDAVAVPEGLGATGRLELLPVVVANVGEPLVG
jgi:predicted RNA polymerase sigma factor